MTFSSFFGTLRSNRQFPKKIFRIFVEKTFEKAQHTLRLWIIRQSIDIEDWFVQNLKKSYTFRNPTQIKTRSFFHWEVRSGFCTVLNNRNWHPFSESAWFGEILPEKLYFSKIRPKIKSLIMTFFNFFWYPLLELIVSKIYLKFLLKKLIKKGQHTLHWGIFYDNRLILKVGKKNLQLPKPDKK